MAQRLFTTAKVGVFLDKYGPGVEKRRGEEVNVITLTCRVQPFDGKLATSLDSGVGGDSNIKSTVFSMNTGEPKPNFTRHDFKLGMARQDLEMFASSDTPHSRVALTQARIHGTYVRSQKDMPSALALVFKASFGPVGRDELEFVHAWFRGQQSVTFHETQTPLAFDEAPVVPEKKKAKANGKDVDTPDMLPPHEFDTGPDGRIVDAEPATPAVAHDAPEPARRIQSRHQDTKSAAKAKQQGKKRR